MNELQTTGRRREVGAALKRIRQERGLPAYRLADQLGNTSCVEVAFAASAVGVRDSKNTGGPTLAFSPIAWRRFVRG